MATAYGQGREGSVWTLDFAKAADSGTPLDFSGNAYISGIILALVDFSRENCSSLQHWRITHEVTNMKMFPNLHLILAPASVERGVVDRVEDSQELEADLQGGHAGESGPIHTTCVGALQSSSRTPVGVINQSNLSMTTLAASLQAEVDAGLLTPSRNELAPTASPITPFWRAEWSKYPVLLPAEETRAKLHEICKQYGA